ncbi:hypothetical protein N0V93_006676 [Gnomoniopsis smithogilvyi]|uniref:Zn(2)-C6 fungal-type domain-containing protein n=1 Tax=Gnomoniopsis smithogilvyi TaxID=1191159 RepID=A0A9W8YNN4_9PEZI|nr:hypothetical protein N0V93_006676 [Gnomoniopsis smithogilvyi]
MIQTTEQDMMDDNSLVHLLQSAGSEEELGDDEMDMADSSSQHEGGTPSDHSVSTPSEAGPDGDTTTAKSVAGTKKRKQSGTDANGNAKPVKKRASQACEICRSRKVRCDSEKRHPCTNCADMGLVCHIPESKRRRRHLNASISTHAILPNPIPQDLPNASSCSQKASDEAQLCAGDSFLGRGCHGPQLYRTYGAGPAADQSTWGPSEEAQAWRTVVPPLIKSPVQGKITREGLRYLESMGALELPSRVFEKQLLLAYIEHVHPDFPMLELRDFLRRISDRNGGNGQVSLLLYQSVMFAASAFVKLEHMTAAGFASRRALRRAILSAAKLLYDFDYENDKFTLTQSSLLLSFWYEAPDDAKETWHWSGIAISQAQALGLHRSTISAANMDPVKKRQRRRVWWSCVMRDRQIGLGMSRLIRIKDEDFDIPMLEESDFEIGTLDDNLLVMPEDCPMMYDIEMQQALAGMCIQKARLYVLIGHVLQAVQSFMAAVTNRTIAVPTMITDHLEDFEKVHRELSAWAAALPPTCHYRNLQPSDIEAGRTPVAMQRSLLHMLYQTTIGKVYHPLIRPPRATTTEAGRAEQVIEQHITSVARQKCREAAAEITRMAGEMHALELDQYFPTTGVTVIMPAMLIHLQGVSDPEEAVREQSQRGFDICMSVLNTLRGTYAAAEYAAIFMDNVIRNKPLTGSMNSGLMANRSSGHAGPGQDLRAMGIPSKLTTGRGSASNTATAQAFASMMQSGTMAATRLQPRTQMNMHPGLNEFGMANLSAMTQRAAPFNDLDSQQQSSITETTLPNITAPPGALMTTTSTTIGPTTSSNDHWPVELIPSDAQGGMSMTPETEEGYTLVAQDNSGGADFPAEVEGLNFPQLGDESWQNWLNLPPEQELAGDGWLAMSEGIDPGALSPHGGEVML